MTTISIGLILLLLQKQMFPLPPWLSNNLLQIFIISTPHFPRYPSRDCKSTYFPIFLFHLFPFFFLFYNLHTNCLSPLPIKKLCLILFGSMLWHINLLLCIRQILGTYYLFHQENVLLGLLGIHDQKMYDGPFEKYKAHLVSEGFSPVWNGL